MDSSAVRPDGVYIRTIGSLSISLGITDLTGQLNDRPLLAFIWLYLLARAIRWPNDALARSALADQLAPKLAAREQARRVKRPGWDLAHELPDSLRDRVA